MYEINQELIGKRIKSILIEKNITQKELSEKIDMDPPLLNKYINNKNDSPINLNDAIKISRGLNTTLDYLIYGEGQKDYIYLENNTDYTTIFNSLILLFENDLIELKSKEKSSAIAELKFTKDYYRICFEFIKKLKNIKEIEELSDYKGTITNLITSFSNQFKNIKDSLPSINE